MPGIVMHHHFGRVVFSALNDEVKRKIYNIDLYDYATSGPDAFIYNNFLNSKLQKESKSFSILMHRTHTKDFISKMIEVSRVDFNMFNYLCGFITHYFLDTYTNPYIYHKVGIYEKDDIETLEYRGLHMRLERAMDCYVIENYYEGKPHKFNIKRKILKLKKINKSSKEGFDRLYLSVYGKNDGYKYVNSSIKWQRRFYGLIYDPFGFKQKMFTKKDNGVSSVDWKQLTYFEKTIPQAEYDIFNFYKKEWNHPVDKDIVQNSSFFELFDKAKKLAVDAINDLYKHVFERETFDLDLYFKDLSYITGLPCVYDLEMKYFDIIFKK